VTRYQTSSLPVSPLTSSRRTHHRSARTTRVYVSVPLRTLLQSWYRSVVYQVRVVFLLPVPVLAECLTRRVADVHFFTRRGRVALTVFAERWRTLSRSPKTSSVSGSATRVAFVSIRLGRATFPAASGSAPQAPSPNMRNAVTPATVSRCLLNMSPPVVTG